MDKFKFKLTLADMEGKEITRIKPKIAKFHTYLMPKNNHFFEEWNKDFLNKEMTFTAEISDDCKEELDKIFREARLKAIYNAIVENKGNCILTFKNTDYIMEWKNIEEVKPNDGARVLVCDTYYKQVRILVYNEDCECWDDEEGDDYECELPRCPYWTELPKFKDIKS